MLNILTYDFFRVALLGSALTAVVCGLIGTYVVTKRIVFISGGITHASFGGVGLGLFLGVNPLWTATLVAIAAGLGVDVLGRRGGMRQDSAIAAVWALGMALGIIFMSLVPGYTGDLSSYLFGNILLIAPQDLYYLGALAIVLVAVFAVFYRPILYTTFDPDFAHTRGLPVVLIERLMLVMVCISIVLSIRLVGIMLLISLLTLPQSIVNLFTRDARKIAIGSVLLGLVASVSGLFASYYLELPSGACIILILVLLYFLASFGKRYSWVRQ